MAKEKPGKKPNWYGSPHRRSPELYYGQVWIEHEMYDSVRMFADWNKLSMKSAAHQLLNFGLTYYAIAQLRLEQARQANEKTPTPTKLFFQVKSLMSCLASIKNGRNPRKF